MTMSGTTQTRLLMMMMASPFSANPGVVSAANSSSADPTVAHDVRSSSPGPEYWCRDEDSENEQLEPDKVADLEACVMEVFRKPVRCSFSHKYTLQPIQRIRINYRKSANDKGTEGSLVATCSAFLSLWHGVEESFHEALEVFEDGNGIIDQELARNFDDHGIYQNMCRSDPAHAPVMSPESAVLDLIEVSPFNRRWGIGRKLVERLVAEIAEEPMAAKQVFSLVKPLVVNSNDHWFRDATGRSDAEALAPTGFVVMASLLANVGFVSIPQHEGWVKFVDNA